MTQNLADQHVPPVQQQQCQMPVQQQQQHPVTQNQQLPPVQQFPILNILSASPELEVENTPKRFGQCKTPGSHGSDTSVNWNSDDSFTILDGSVFVHQRNPSAPKTQLDFQQLLEVQEEHTINTDLDSSTKSIGPTVELK